MRPEKAIPIILMLSLAGWAQGSPAPMWQELMERADSLSRIEDYSSAALNARQALGMVETSFGSEDTTVAVISHKLAAYEHNLGHYEPAESLYHRALAIWEKVVGSEHMEATRCLNDLGMLYGATGRYSEAEDAFHRALAVREKVLGTNHLDVAKSLMSLGRVHEALGRYEEAESEVTRALAIREESLGSDHPRVAESLDMLSGVYRKQAKLNMAEEILRRAISIREESFGLEHPLVVGGYHDLANLYVDQGEYARAETLYIRALEVGERALGHDDPRIANCLDNLAILYEYQARYLEAEPLFREALAIRKRIFDAGHVDIGKSFNNLASLYYLVGRYDEAAPLYGKAVAILEHALGSQHPNVAAILNNWAALYNEQGKYAESQPLLEKALGIWETTLGADHPYVADGLLNLFHVHYYEGRLKDAEPLGRRVLAIRRKTLGEDHPSMSFVLSDMGCLYMNRGSYREAESLFVRALEIGERVLGPNHPQVGLNLANLAQAYHYQERYAEAESLYLAGLRVVQKGLSTDDPSVASILVNLARLYGDLGRHDESEQIFARALAIREKALGFEHPDVAALLEYYSQIRWQQNEMVKSMDLALRAFRIRRKNFQDNGHVLPEVDALTYSQMLRASAHRFLSYCTYAGFGGSGRSTDAADVILASKGSVSDGIFARQRAIVTETDSTVLALAQRLRLAKFRLAELFVGDLGEDVEDYRAKVDSLSSAVDDLEADISRQSASFRREQACEDISAERIASLLPENSVLVEYVRYDYLQLESGERVPHYMVLVITESLQPVILELGEIDEIDAQINRYRDHMLRVSSAGRSPTPVDKQHYEKLAKDLHGLIWEPLDEYVTGKDLVLIAPDGALNMISFAGLVDSRGRYLVERFPIHYLSSGRDVIRLKNEIEPASGLFALGDPDYDALAETRVPNVAAAEDTIPELAHYRARNVRSVCGDLKDITVRPLPGTRSEIEKITLRWKESTDEPFVCWFGQEASEERFKAEAPNKRVLHLATHGYFLEKTCQPEQLKSDLKSDIPFVGENPLLLSGLFFAGANLHGEVADSLGAEDGILTAYEVSAMDLSGTQMVVLSACETGLGRVEEGEGVYGLRRAFQMAGARTVISALWPVYDEATADMMSQLYEAKGQSAAETMRRIQLDRIIELRKQDRPDHPFTWAAFIALGDWR